MKKRLLLVFLALVFVGAYAHNAAAATICIDIVGSCNDVRLVYSSVGPGMYEVSGFEYGCGAPERALDGSLRIDGQTAYIQYITNATTSYATPRIGQWNLQLNLSSQPFSGPGQFSYHYDGYHSGVITATVVPCIADAEGSSGEDAGE